MVKHTQISFLPSIQRKYSVSAIAEWERRRGKKGGKKTENKLRQRTEYLGEDS